MQLALGYLAVGDALFAVERDRVLLVGGRQHLGRVDRERAVLALPAAFQVQIALEHDVVSWTRFDGAKRPFL